MDASSTPWLAWAAGWRLIDLVIVITLLEGVALALHHRMTGRGLAPADFMPSLASGLALMIALRAALDGAPAAWVAAALMLAGLAHAADLRRRWRRRR
jgi:hypothetical protein